MGLYQVHADIDVCLSLKNADGGNDTYTIRNGDMIANMTIMGGKDPISGQVVEIGVEPRSSVRNSYRLYDGIPLQSKEINRCRVVRSFDEATEVKEIVIHDPTTCEHHHVKVADIETIESVAPCRVVVKSGDKIAEAIDALEDGQYIYLDAGDYEEDLTITKSVAIIGAGNGVVTITGNVSINTAEPMDCVIIGGVKITNAATANIGMVTVTSGNLHLIDDVLVVTGAKGIAECSAINRAVTAAETKNHILVDGCTVLVEGGEAGDFNYGIAIGTATGKDMGDLMLSVIDSTISASYVGIYCTARGKVDLTVVRSTVKAFGAFYMNHNGETSVDGTFDASFTGSVVRFEKSKLVGVQSNVASLDEDGCDCNTFATLSVSNTKNLKAQATDCTIRAENDTEVELNGGAMFAPMYALMIDDKSEKCIVDLDTSVIKMVDPAVETPILNGNPKLCGVKGDLCKVYGIGTPGQSYPFYTR